MPPDARSPFPPPCRSLFQKRTHHTPNTTSDQSCISFLPEAVGTVGALWVAPLKTSPPSDSPQRSHRSISGGCGPQCGSRTRTPCGGHGRCSGCRRAGSRGRPGGAIEQAVLRRDAKNAKRHGPRPGRARGGPPSMSGSCPNNPRKLAVSGMDLPIRCGVTR